MMDEIFDLKMPKTERVNTGNIWEDMNANLDRVFPDEKELGKILRLAKPEDKTVKNVFAKKYLPYNFRDNQWLGTYVHDIYHQVCPQANISNEDAKKYVAKSFTFNKQRGQFETMLIKEVTKAKTLGATDLNPIKIRDEVLKTVTDDFGISRYHAGVQMEKNNAWRIIIYNRCFEKYLQDQYAVSFPSIEDLNVLCANHPNQFADFMWMKNSALNAYQQYGERRYFDGCKDARLCAYEAGYKIEDLSLVEKKQTEMKVEKFTNKLVSEIKACQNLLGHDLEIQNS